MNKKKRHITIVIILIVIILAVVIFCVQRHQTNNDFDKLEIVAIDYFNDTNTIETSVWALKENDYIKTDTDKCVLIKKGEKIDAKYRDCKKAESYAKIPVIILEATDGFKINEWNQIGTELSFHFKNNGNSYYKEEDIASVSWVNDFTGEAVASKTLMIPNENIKSNFYIYIHFKDNNAFERKFQIKIDTKGPVLKSKKFEGENVHSYYEDNLEMKAIYYAVTDQKSEPRLEDMKEEIHTSYECGKTYYAWSYAEDAAGNKSQMDYLGDYEHVCVQIGAGTNNLPIPEDERR